MSLIEYARDIVRRRLARDPRSTASTDDHWVCIKTILNALPHADF